MRHAPNFTLKTALRLHLGLSALEGGIAALWLLRLPSEGMPTLLRWGMLLFLLGGSALSLAGLHPRGQVRILSRWQAAWVDTPRNRRRTFWLLLAAFNGLYLLTLPPDLTDVSAQTVLKQVAPLLFYLSVLCLQSALLRPVWKTLFRDLPAKRFALGVFAGLLLAWAFIARSRWGLQPQSEYFYEMGVPILESQLLLVWMLTIAGRKLWEARSLRSLRLTRRQVDALLVIGLYLMTVTLWQSGPDRSTWFTTLPAPPNNEVYPASDALRYDTTAQNVLIGNGLQTENDMRTLRPLYTGLLAALHALFGLGYKQVAQAQVWLLALWVVPLYHLGRRFHSRTAGVLLTALLSLQGYTNIAYANRFTISHARLLMADLPMTVLTTTFLLLAVRWQQRRSPRWQDALYGGAVLGALLMVRPESIVIGAIALLTAFFHRRANRRQWARQAAIFTLGTVLVTAPWVGRNWVRYGKPFFDAPEGRIYEIIQRAKDSFTQPPPEPQEPEALPPVTPTTQPNPEGSTGKFPHDALPTPPVSNNLPVLIIQHYLNSEIQSFLALPLTFRLPDTLLSYGFITYHDWQAYRQARQGDNPQAAEYDFHIQLYNHNTQFWAACCGGEAYVARLPLWPYVTGLPYPARMLLVGNLLLVAFGLSLAIRRWGWVGAFPALAHSAYLALNALFLISGGRYIQPVNWIVIFYYALGIAALTLGVGRALGWLKGSDDLLRGSIPQGDRAPRKGVRFPRWAGGILPLGAVLLLGLAIPLGERAFPQRYSPATQTRMEAAVLGTLSSEERAQVDGLQIYSGRALYPRYLRAAEGNPLSDAPFVEVQPYGRLVFFIIGPYNGVVRLPLKVKEMSTPFPNGSDVVVAGCVQEADGKTFFDAHLVARVSVEGQVQAVLWRKEDIASSCR